MLIALLNASTYLADKADQVSLIAQAISLQLRLHAAPAWSASPWACVFYPDQKLVPRSAYRLWLLDDPDTAGALGYHDQDPQGFPYGKVFTKPILESGGDVLASSNSISCTTSHEALEMFGDAQANLWAQMDSGELIALELCDPVESDAYMVKVGTTSVAVSNFVYPEYFDGAPEGSRFDQLKKIQAPFTMTEGGYQILMTAGQVRNVFGAAYPDWKRPLKEFAGARTARRGKSSADPQ